MAGATADGLYVGLMSGTSADGIDAALIQFERDGFQFIEGLHQPHPEALRQRIHTLADQASWQPEAMGELDVELGQAFANATLALLRKANTQANQVIAIGSHGQTIRHQPPGMGHTPFSLQIGDANTIAEHTGIDTVADFRRRDMAAGGQGAPLAPGFHFWAWGRNTAALALVNLGGISNLSWLDDKGAEGFDCGPANTLMDAWCLQHQHKPYDHNGQWAAQGRVSEALLSKLLEHPFLRLKGPKSTGREAFNLSWLKQLLAELPPLPAEDVQATLCRFSALCIAQHLHNKPATSLYCCGGGAYNQTLLNQLQALLPGWRVLSTQALGLAPEWIEATAFAWLAYCFTSRLPGNLPQVTGAHGPRRLGALYPAR